MSDFIKTAREWLSENKGALFLQCVVIPGLTAFLAWIAKQFVEPGMVRDIGFYVICVAVIAGGCCLLFWFDRKKRRPTTTETPEKGFPAESRLRLLRMIAEGAKRLKAFQTIAPGDALGALDATADIQEWYREALTMVRAQYESFAEHFADLEPLGAKGVDGCDEQMSLLLTRMRGIADVLPSVAQ